MKPTWPSPQEAEGALDRLLPAVGVVLEEDGAGETGVAHEEVAGGGVDGSPGVVAVSAEVDGDGGRVGARCDHEVVAEAALVAEEDDVDARPHVGVGDPAVGGNARLPGRRVVAGEVVGVAGERVEGGGLGGRVGADQSHLEGPVRAGQGDVGGGGREGEAVAGAPGQVVDADLGLAHVGLEAEGERGQGVESRGRGGTDPPAGWGPPVVDSQPGTPAVRTRRTSDATRAAAGRLRIPSSLFIDGVECRRVDGVVGGGP